MAICPKCGTYAPDGIKKCTICDAPIPQNDEYRSAPQPHEAQEAPRARVFYQPEVQNDGPRVLWYIGMMMLFAIPVVGFVMTIIIAAGGGNKAKRHFGAANLILKIIGIVLALIMIIGLAAAISETNFENGLPIQYWDEFFEGDWDEIPRSVWERFPDSFEGTFPNDSWENIPNDAWDQLPDNFWQQIPDDVWENFPYGGWEDLPNSGSEKIPNM